MEQLSLPVLEKSEVEILASSSRNFQIERVIKVGIDDHSPIIEISDELVKIFGKHARMNKHTIKKFFNEQTFPFFARYNGQIIGYIIGVPLEYFQSEPWASWDINLGKNNTIYTYSFIFLEKYRKRNGYARMLKRVYVNWARKQKDIKFITGHVKQGLARKFSKDTQIVKIWDEWYGAQTPFEYYRRPIN